MMKEYIKAIQKDTNAQYNRTERYVRIMRRYFEKASRKLTEIALRADYSPSEGQFHFSDYPVLNRQAKKVIRELARDIQTVVGSGTSTEWTNANRSMDAFVNSVLLTAGVVNREELTGELMVKYFNNHDSALKAFKQRTVNGLNLSRRVWNYAGNALVEHELSFSVTMALNEGMSAVDLSKKITQYLVHQDDLMKDAKEAFGQFKMSGSQKGYGPGVYKDPLMNAQRLARNEINNAYRTAENQRYMDFDFVVGKEIKRSTHEYECNDVCEMLKGKYPKDFKFVGWHPNCRCFEIPILCTPQEIREMTKARIEGRPYELHSINEVKDVPQGFKDWVNENRDRIDASREKGTTPYFINSNEKYLIVSKKVDYSRVDTFFSEEEKSQFFTSVDKVFYNKYDPIKDETARELSKGRAGTVFAPKGDVVNVDVKDIYPAQSVINAKNVIRLSKDIEANGITDAPFAIKVGSDVYVLDGHHRVSAEIIAGRKTVTLRVVEVTEEEWEEMYRKFKNNHK